MRTSTTFTLRAVCTSGPRQEPVKHPREQVRVGLHGLEGDRHAGATIVLGHGRHKGRPIPNERQWSAVSVEEMEEGCRLLGIPALPAGGLGENLLLQGLPQLTSLPRGTQLHFDSGVVLEIREENLPCVGPARYWAEALEREDLQRTFVKTFMGRRGVVGVVLRPGILCPGERGRLRLRREEPAPQR